MFYYTQSPEGFTHGGFEDSASDYFSSSPKLLLGHTTNQLLLFHFSMRFSVDFSGKSWPLHLDSHCPLKAWYFCLLPISSGTPVGNCIFVFLLSHIWLFATPWTGACQTPLSAEFSRQNTGVGSHFLPQGSSQPRDQTHISCISCISMQILYYCNTWEAQGSSIFLVYHISLLYPYILDI